MKAFLLVLLILAGCKSPDVSEMNPLDSYLNPASKDDSELRDEYMGLVNAVRVHPLQYSSEMEDVAQEHSENMARGLVPFGHTGSSERCQKIITALGPANLCGEIVAQGQDDPLAVFNAWMSSSTHKSKIMNDRYTHTALGIARNSRGVIFWTQIFLEVL